MDSTHSLLRAWVQCLVRELDPICTAKNNILSATTRDFAYCLHAATKTSHSQINMFVRLFVLKKERCSPH